MLEDLRKSAAGLLGLSGQYWLCLAALSITLFFGGGSRQWLPSEFICQVCGVVFLAVALCRVAVASDVRRLAPELCFVGLVLRLPMAQLVPLPPFIWSNLPGRGLLVEEFQVAQSALPWQPISLAPYATWQALFSLCGPLSVFVFSLLLTFEERRLLSLFLLAFGLLSVVLAMLQLVQGADSPLRFYTITNPTLPVGFFANRNHFAAFLYSLLPLAAAWVVGLGVKLRKSRRSRDIDPKKLFADVVAAGVFVALMLIQGLVHSRAGLVITILSALASFGLALPYRKHDVGTKAIKVLFGALVVAVVLMAYYASYRIMQQFDRDPVDDARFTIITGALKALKSFFPVGSGFGTFDIVYRAFELPSAVSGEYVNRAHDDFIETLIEGGMFSLALIGLFVAWLVRAFWRVWSAKFRDISVLDASLARAGALVPVLLILHSFLDYPLRTEAVMSLLAFCCALTVWPVNGSTEGDDDRKRTRRKRRIKPEGAVGDAAS